MSKLVEKLLELSQELEADIARLKEELEAERRRSAELEGEAVLARATLERHRHEARAAIGWAARQRDRDREQLAREQAEVAERERTLDRALADAEAQRREIFEKIRADERRVRQILMKRNEEAQDRISTLEAENAALRDRAKGLPPLEEPANLRRLRPKG